MLNITNEARALQGPWTTLVKGRGLGAITRNYSCTEAKNIQSVANLVDAKLQEPNAYNTFSHKLVDFILDFNNPNFLFFQRKDLYPRVDEIVNCLKQINDPYYYISASSILFESFGKLGLDPQILVSRSVDLVSDALGQLERLPNATVKDRYKSVQAYGNIFLGIAHIGLTNRLYQEPVDYVKQAFDIVYSLDDVWHHGRGMAAFLTVLGVIGFYDHIEQSKNNHTKNLVCFLSDSLDDVEKVKHSTNEYVFSILLMLNAFSVIDGHKYLEYKRDWISVAGALLEDLPPDLKLIFTHYYLSALYNLGVLDEYVPDASSYVKNAMLTLSMSDESELDYMGYTYFIDLGFRLGFQELITEEIYNNLMKNIACSYDFSTNNSPQNLLYGSGFMRISYALIALSYQNKTSLIFNKDKTFRENSLVEGIIQNQLDNWPDDHESLSFLNHALIDMSLSLRGGKTTHSLVDNVLFFKSNEKDKKILDIKEIANKKRSAISIHPFFTGMNSRRFYKELDKSLYDEGTADLKRIFERASDILGYSKAEESYRKNISPFFMGEASFPKDVIKLWNYIGSSMTVYNLALFEQLKNSSDDFVIHSVGGESYGMIAAAIVSGSLTLEDGLKVANNILGLIYEYAHLNDFGTWHIVSLSSVMIESDLCAIQDQFPGHIDVFRWQAINSEKNEVHVYINAIVFEDVKKYLAEKYNNVSFSEFKRPTIEIIHSPKLSPARVIINNFLIDNNIQFLKPRIPIVSNNGSGVIFSAERVRDLVLDMTNIPMYTAQAFASIKELGEDSLDAIVEIGYGQKTQSLINQNNIKNHFFEYYGDKYKLKSVSDNILDIKEEKIKNQFVKLAKADLLTY